MNNPLAIVLTVLIGVALGHTFAWHVISLLPDWLDVRGDRPLTVAVWRAGMCAAVAITLYLFLVRDDWSGAGLATLLLGASGWPFFLRRPRRPQ